MRLFALWLAPLLLAEILTARNAEERLKAIDDTGLDAAQCYRVRDLFIEKEDVKIYFTDGHLIFGRPLDGRTISALFVASSSTDTGEIILLPPNEAERQALARFTREPVLNSKFRTAALFFTDDTAERLRDSISRSPYNRIDEGTGGRLADRWASVMRELMTNVRMRTMLDSFARTGPEEGFFAAAIGGGPLGRFDVVVDPTQREQVTIGQTVWREGRAYQEIWCRFAARSYREGRRKWQEDTGWLQDYHIESTLEPDLNMAVTVKAKFVPATSRMRAFAFELSEVLEVESVLLDGKPVEFLQADQPLTADTRRRLNNLLTVILDDYPSEGATYDIEFRYRGRVIADAGDGVYFVGSRGSWYPRRKLRFTEFELVFHHPEELSVVATGRLVDSSRNEGVQTSTFRSDAPIRIAGFNLGRYQRVAKTVDGVTIEACANEGLEARLQPKPTTSVVLTDPTPRQRRRRFPGETLPSAVVLETRPAAPPSPAARLPQVADDAADALKFFMDRFGPPPLKNIVISPIPGDFGQGFPGLVYAATLSYFNPSDPPLQQLKPFERLFYSQQLQPHEIAHQWWGNIVAVDTDSDDWLMESLATYSSLLYLEHKHGRAVLDEALAEFKNHLLAPNEAGEAIEQAGAVVLGSRLRSSQFPTARRVIVYEKGAWILHMLRGIMGDEKFFEFLRSLRDDFAFKALTNEDFRAHAARYVPDAWPDSTLVNFFDQWVYGTGIPKLSVTFINKGKAPRFEVEAQLQQVGVPEHFSAPVSLEIRTLPGRSLVKEVHTDGDLTPLKVILQNAASSIVIDPANWLLAIKE